MAGPAITPRTLKGFRDQLPARALLRERCIDTAKAVFRSFGYAPIDTPALEYAEVLLGKLDPDAEIQRQIYRFRDQGDRDVALRFDLTVPFARFAAQHIAELGIPFKRYHVGTAWRGENTQAGRLREFLQCDFDTIGTTSNAADAEVAIVITELLDALAVGPFRVHLNSRLVLSGLLSEQGLGDRAGAVLRAIDKLAKQGRDAVVAELVEAGMAEVAACDVLDLLAGEGGSSDALARAEKAGGGNEQVAEGVRRLRQTLAVAAAAGVPDGRLVVDLSIARGLDYYTGTVYETFLDDLPGIGSVCSGGRYDDLAGLYTKQSLPGVGASLGLDRLLDALEQTQGAPTESTPAPALVVSFGDEGLAEGMRTAAALRRAGIGVEVFPDPKKVGVQLAYAERRGFRVALLAGPQELAAGVVKVKDLASRTEVTVPAADVIDSVRSVLG